MNNEITTRGQLIKETGATTDVGLMALGTCQLAVLAVGGGGKGYNAMYGGGGAGGSGFVEFSTLNFTGITTLQVTVGGADQKSVLSVEGKVEVEAGPGRTGVSFAGGAGYSGGGAGSKNDWAGSENNPGAGGTGGGDGHNSTTHSGGKGSGFDVGTILLKDFAIT